MKSGLKLFSVFMVVLLAAACSPAAPTVETMMEKPTVDTMMASPTVDAMMEKPTEDMMMASPTVDAMMEKPTEDMMMATPTVDTMMATPAGDMMTSPAWYSVSLTDAHSGDSLSIDSLKGKVVLVETMAVWCTTCKKQQLEMKALHENLGMPADLVTISLDVDTQESMPDLKDYVESNGFDWHFAVAGEDVTREISNLYGAQFLNPPSTPMLIIDRQGVAHALPFGVKSAADLQKAVEMYLNQGM